MATQKPSKPGVTLPDNFGGIKTPYSDAQIRDGYQDGVPEIVDGGNINYEKDALFQNNKYLRTVADTLVDMPIGKILTVDSNNRFDYVEPVIIASDEEYEDGIITTKSPSVKQVRDSFADLDGRITNCITEIPQDIKLELANGVLTLKAGSKVYVPNGAGKFDEAVVQQDTKINTHNSTSGKFLACYRIGDKKAWGNNLVTNCGSGTDATGVTGFYYRTDTNKLDYYNNGIAEGYTWSLPICILDSTNGTVTSLDQVFNGFGYIGSTVFALPGVKGLIPNGRNEDGSLKNIEFTTSNVLTFTNTEVESDYYISLSSDAISRLYYTSWRYDDEQNRIVGLSTNAGKTTLQCMCGVFTYKSGSITSFAPKQPFHAVDYYDYAEADAQNVKLTGNQAINGRKTFNGSGIGIIKSGSAIDIQNKAVDLSVTDGSVYGTTEIHLIDKNGIVQGIFEHQNRNNGDSIVIMAARNHANTAWTSMEVGFDKNDIAFSKAPTPPMNSNGSNIATTDWARRSTAGIPNYAAGVAITATGTYTTPSKGVLIGTPINTNSSESLKIQIDSVTFFFCPGNSGEDNTHLSQCYLPMNKGQSYKVIELNKNVQLYFFPFL